MKMEVLKPLSKSELDWDKFEPEFGTWAEAIKPFFYESGFDPIYAKLREVRSRNRMICPLPTQLYRCFKETSLDSLRCVIVGLSPYHTMLKGKMIADGLALSCSNTGVLQPSLSKYYEAIDNEFDMNSFRDPSLQFLANQGVLLFNASLTAEMFKAGSHLEIWEPFMKFIFETVFSDKMVPIIFLGKEAQKLEKYVAPFQWNFKISHPAFAARMQTKWDSEGAFTAVNKILTDAKQKPIDWAFELPF